MPNPITDFLFGKAALKKAADTSTPAPQSQAPASPYQNFQQIQAQAQRQADLQRQQEQNAKIPAGHFQVANPGSHQDKLDHE
ncbi:MAG: hypothetical protein LAP38_03290 [Acidobacteriia bacterium]|nr:hypothetical protein [Terriglobia bacterium]